MVVFCHEGNGFAVDAAALVRSFHCHRHGGNRLRQPADHSLVIKAGKPELALSNFDYAGPMTEALLLGNVALRVGRRLNWDGEKLEFSNYGDANQFVSKPYREGWKFEA